MDARTRGIVAASVAGLMAAAGAVAMSGLAQAGEQVACYGINKCKGAGDCGGKGHACAGKNACKGAGTIKLDKETCLKIEGGRLTEQKS